MKNKVYVERFAERLVNKETAGKAIGELADCFINEYNAEVLRRHVRTPEQQKALLNDLNRKGNELAEMLEAKTGRPVLVGDWFRVMFKMIEEDRNGGTKE